MPDLCLCIQIHQPHRLRRYTVFDTDENYFDVVAMTESSRLASQNCYLPLFALLTKLIKRHRGRFQFSLLVTGPALSLLPDLAPEAFSALKILVARPEVHLIGGTSHHTAAALHVPTNDTPTNDTPTNDFPDPTSLDLRETELSAQIASCRTALLATLGKAPTAFAGPELLYSNAIARVASRHYDRLLAPDVAALQANTAHPLHAAGLPSTVVLPVNLGLSALLSAGPLTPPPAGPDLAAQIMSAAPLTTLVVNAHTFGITQPLASGPFDRLSSLVTALFDQGANFIAPADIPATQANAAVDLPNPTSDRPPAGDLAHLLGNAMQISAHAAWLKLGARIIPRALKSAPPKSATPKSLTPKSLTHKSSPPQSATPDPHPLSPAHPKLPDAKFPDANLLDAWRRLGSLDHFLHMSTLHMQTPASPHLSPQSHYDSPYDAYINFMNVLDSLSMRLAAAPPAPPRLAT